MRASRRGLGCLALCASLGASLAMHDTGARADLRGPRDLDRALELLYDEDDDDARARGARWMATHGTDAVVVPELLDAIEGEDVPSVVQALAAGIAQRARPEDADRILQVERRVRASARSLLVVALAQLGAEASDAWLVERLSSPMGSELRPALEQVAEIARTRRDELLPRVLDAIAQRQSPLLLVWLASLEDERARGALLTAAVAPSHSSAQSAALEGLARLGPDTETARRLAELTTALPSVQRELVRALLAADPRADVSTHLDSPDASVRRATLEALVARAPDRALQLLGSDPRAIAEADRGVLPIALTHPSAPLVPWFEGIVHDDVLAPTLGSRALEALIQLPHCALAIDDGLLVDREERRLAAARLARACTGETTTTLPSAELEGLALEDALHLRAIAGEDVRDALEARWGQGVSREARLTLAHAWLASRRGDARVLAHLGRETDDEVLAVLALAARTRGLNAPPSLWEAVLTDEARSSDARLVALDGLAGSTGTLSPRAARAVDQTSAATDGAAAALALHVVERHAPLAATARLCAALASTSRPLRHAAAELLTARAERPTCLLRRARIDDEVRRQLLAASVAASPTAPSAPGPAPQPLLLRVVSNVGGALPRVTLETGDGRTLRLRPPPSGFVVVQGLGPVGARVRLDAEPDLGGTGDR